MPNRSKINDVRFREIWLNAGALASVPNAGSATICKDFLTLVREAVGANGWIDQTSIKAENFPQISGTRTRKRELELVPCTGDETGEQAAKRLVDEGCTLEDGAALAAFFRKFPERFKNVSAVLALAENSRWNDAGQIRVPCAYVYRGQRCFETLLFHAKFSPNSFILVSRRTSV